MRIAEVAAFGPPETAVRLTERPDPEGPGPGEVLIAAELAPINPADLVNIQGLYGAAAPRLPMTPGSEGVGRVVRCGAGVTGLEPGNRVLLPGPGTWREQCVAPAAGLVPLPDDVDPAQLAMLRVNPATAWVMLHDFVPPVPGRWVIQNAANSGVGHCLIRLARELGLRTVNVVRRPELIEPLEAAGGDVVLVDGPDLDVRVRAAIGEGRLPLGIDAVAGSGTRRLARCVDEGGVVVNYGMMSGEACRVDVRDTVFRNVTLRGFWLRHWFGVTPREVIGRTYGELVGKIASGVLAVAVERIYPFDEIGPALAHAGRQAREGKILLRFHAA